MDRLEFRKLIVVKYYKDYATKLSFRALFPKSVLKNHVNIRMAETNHHGLEKENKEDKQNLVKKALKCFFVLNAMLDYIQSGLRVFILSK